MTRLTILLLLSTIHAYAATKAQLLGSHALTLQWIGWDHPGRAEVSEAAGIIMLRGEQRAANGDYLTVDGTITDFAERTFMFEGEIVTRISHIADGEPCRRQGRMAFLAKGHRKYWRLQAMDNPCDDVVDYVDLYFRIPRFALKVDPDPADARVRVMNIKPVYVDGMQLPQGRYKLEVSKAGYRTRTLWVDLDAAHTTFTVVLEPLENIWTE